MSTRYWSTDDLAEIRNARGFNIPWQRIAGHYGVSVEAVQQAVGAPQWRSEPVQHPEPDLFAGLERLEGQL
jgi:hypothetical protein